MGHAGPCWMSLGLHQTSLGLCQITLDEPQVRSDEHQPMPDHTRWASGCTTVCWMSPGPCWASWDVLDERWATSDELRTVPGEPPAVSRGMRGGLVAPGPSRKVQGQPEKCPICRAPQHIGPLAQPHHPAGARSTPQPPGQTERWGKILLGSQVRLPWCAPAMPKSALGRERVTPSPAFTSSSPLGTPDQTKILVGFFFPVGFCWFLFFVCFFPLASAHSVCCSVWSWAGRSGWMGDCGDGGGVRGGEG